MNTWIIALIAGIFILTYLIGKFIVNPQSLPAKAMIAGIEFILIILFVALLSYIIIKLVLKDDTIIETISVVSLLLLFIFSTERIRTILSQQKIISIAIWMICVLGIALYPIYVIDANQFRVGDMRHLWWLAGMTTPSIIIGVIGFYLSLKYYVFVIIHRGSEK